MDRSRNVGKLSAVVDGFHAMLDCSCNVGKLNAAVYGLHAMLERSCNVGKLGAVVNGFLALLDHLNMKVNHVMLENSVHLVAWW